jgi:hypothetical protein
MRTANIFIPVSGLACSYGKIFIPPTYDLGKFKRDLGKRDVPVSGSYEQALRNVSPLL